VYTLFLVTTISWVFGRALPSESPWQRANLVPLVGAPFDYLENLSTSLVILRYPEQMAAVAAVAPAFSVLKWTLLGASFILLLGGIAVKAWRWAVPRVRGRSPGPGEGQQR
jgi:hypothetical protein